MIVAGVIGVLIFTNVISLYLYIKEDLVAQNNIKIYLDNEVLYKQEQKLARKRIEELMIENEALSKAISDEIKISYVFSKNEEEQ